MAQLLLLVVVALIVGAIGFGIAVLVSGADPGLAPAEPDGRAQPLPSTRPLTEGDLVRARFDTALRGYRMAQVDAALQRAAYDLGYKEELIEVLLAEVAALRAGRLAEADELRRTRAASLSGPEPAVAAGEPVVAVVAAEAGAAEPPADSPQAEAPAESVAPSAAESGDGGSAGSAAGDTLPRPGEGGPVDLAVAAPERPAAVPEETRLR